MSNYVNALPSSRLTSTMRTYYSKISWRSAMSEQLCLFCRGLGRILIEEHGVLQVSADCPAGCVDVMFDDLADEQETLDDLVTENDDPC